MLFKNGSGCVVTVDLGDIHVLAPGETIEIEEGYWLSRALVNGSRQPSTIEMIAPQLSPVDPEDHTKWMANPADLQQVKNVKRPATKADYMADGMSEGVAEILVAKKKGK